MAAWIIMIPVALIFVGVALSLKTVRPTDRGLIERFGKYNRFGNPSIVWIIPWVERLIRVNITEMMVDAGGQEIITKGTSTYGGQKRNVRSKLKSGATGLWDAGHYCIDRHDFFWQVQRQ